ncbi:toxin-antitoxin system TumE family protein [Dissulfurispira sp.]|uniref:toxin-antitoxin system TumE family protein n=1 Tax=Dissulfurispira sp. TaxID=2817609 RepID=UPI002FDB565B
MGKTELLVHDKVEDKHGGIVGVKVWAVPKSADKPHEYKYSSVYIRRGKRILGYDNAERKGDHRHYKDKEMPYNFKGIDKLFEDFYRDLREVMSNES